MQVIDIYTGVRLILICQTLISRENQTDCIDHFVRFGSVDFDARECGNCSRVHKIITTGSRRTLNV